jgi:hypothetical protein
VTRAFNASLVLYSNKAGGLVHQSRASAYHEKMDLSRGKFKYQGVREMSDLVELAALWQVGGTQDMRSAEIMDDRVHDLVSMLQEGPVRLYLKRTRTKRGSRSPDAVLLIIPRKR